MKQKNRQAGVITLGAPVEKKEKKKFVALESFCFECDGVMKEIRFSQEFDSEEVPERVRKIIKHKES